MKRRIPLIGIIVIIILLLMTPIIVISIINNTISEENHRGRAVKISVSCNGCEKGENGSEWTLYWQATGHNKGPIGYQSEFRYGNKSKSFTFYLNDNNCNLMKAEMEKLGHDGTAKISVNYNGKTQSERLGERYSGSLEIYTDTPC